MLGQILVRVGEGAHALACADGSAFHLETWSAYVGDWLGAGQVQRVDERLRFAGSRLLSAPAHRRSGQG